MGTVCNNAACCATSSLYLSELRMSSDALAPEVKEPPVVAFSAVFSGWSVAFCGVGYPVQKAFIQAVAQAAEVPHSDVRISGLRPQYRLKCGIFRCFVVDTEVYTPKLPSGLTLEVLNRNMKACSLPPVLFQMHPTLVYTASNCPEMEEEGEEEEEEEEAVAALKIGISEVPMRPPSLLVGRLSSEGGRVLWRAFYDACQDNVWCTRGADTLSLAVWYTVMLTLFGFVLVCLLVACEVIDMHNGRNTEMVVPGLFALLYILFAATATALAQSAERKSQRVRGADQVVAQFGPFFEEFGFELSQVKATVTCGGYLTECNFCCYCFDRIGCDSRSVCSFH